MGILTTRAHYFELFGVIRLYFITVHDLLVSLAGPRYTMDALFSPLSNALGASLDQIKVCFPQPCSSPLSPLFRGSSYGVSSLRTPSGVSSYEYHHLNLISSTLSIYSSLSFSLYLSSTYIGVSSNSLAASLGPILLLQMSKVPTCRGLFSCKYIRCSFATTC